MKRPSISPGLKRLLLIPPVVAGVVLVVTLVKSSAGPVEIEASERSTPVRVISTRRLDVVPRAIGYGLVQPGRVWQVVAQVAGRVVEKNERAEEGAPIAAGSVLLRIDQRPYELAVREAEAQIATLQAQLADIDTREANAKRMLAIEQRSLEASKRELTRRQELVESSVVAQSEVDAQESRYLLQLARVGDLESTLNLVPVERQLLEANMMSNQTRREIAQLDLSYTTIEVPYDCRLVRVDFEDAQYVTVGQTLAEAHDVHAAEIAAQVPIPKMRHLISDLPTGPALVTEFLSRDLIQSLGLEAVVRLRSGDFSAQWVARVERLRGTIDPETRTLGVVVVVDEPYQKVIPGVRPPLVQDMFCEVELRGRAKPDRVMIPRAALHGGEVYVVVDGRLRRRPVTIEFTLQDFVCLASGLEGGEALIASDPVPAIEGMLVESVPDAELEERLAGVASGEAPLR